MYKILKDNYLHFWPAGYPLVCSAGICLVCGRPDEWCVGTVGIVAISAGPGVDEVVGGLVGFDHSGFGFEVPFAGGGGG